MWFNPKVIEPTVLAVRMPKIPDAYSRDNGRPPIIVQCSGCFARLHRGHVHGYVAGYGLELRILGYEVCFAEEF